MKTIQEKLFDLNIFAANLKFPNMLTLLVCARNIIYTLQNIQWFTFIIYSIFIFHFFVFGWTLDFPEDLSFLHTFWVLFLKAFRGFSFCNMYFFSDHFSNLNFAPLTSKLNQKSEFVLLEHFIQNNNFNFIFVQTYFRCIKSFIYGTN